jgi:hypothetical protein
LEQALAIDRLEGVIPSPNILLWGSMLRFRKQFVGQCCCNCIRGYASLAVVWGLGDEVSRSESLGEHNASSRGTFHTLAARANQTTDDRWTQIEAVCWTTLLKHQHTGMCIPWCCLGIGWEVQLRRRTHIHTWPFNTHTHSHMGISKWPTL